MDIPSIVVLVLLSSYLVHSSSSNSSNSATAEATSNLTVLSLLPYPHPEGQLQPSWDEGHTLFLTEQMAVDMLNANPDILPGYNLLLASSDSGCNIRSRATLSLVRDTLNSMEPIVGLVGPGCSVSASTVGPLSGREKIALINVHIAGSLLLKDRNRYPYSFGTLDSTEVFAKTIIQLIKDLGWKNVSALYDESRLYYYSTVKLMEREIKADQNLKDLDYFFSATYETFIPLDLIKNRYRIVLLFVGPDLLSKILCLALKNDMVQPIYQFLIVSRVADEVRETRFTYDHMDRECNRTERNKIITNMLVIHYQLKPLNVTTKTHSGLSYEMFDSMYRKKVEDFNTLQRASGRNLTIRPSFWASSYFDAAWSLGLALNHSMAEVNLSTYRFNQPNNSMIIKEKLLELAYEGVSGRIKFDKNSGYAQRNVDIYQVNSSGDMVRVGYYHRINETITIPGTRGWGFNNGHFDSVTVILTAPRFLAIPVLCITAFGFLLVLILQVLTIYYRKCKSVKATSPKVTQLAFIGCYIEVLGSLTNVWIDIYTDKIHPKANCELWHLLNTAAAIGTALIFGTLCARTWRLYRIFVHYNNPGKYMSERFLISCVLLFVMVNIMIIIVWIITDPFTQKVLPYRKEFEEVKEGGVTVNIRIVQNVIHTCTQRYLVLWCVFLMLINVIFMAGAVLLAYLTRHIPYNNFKTRGVMSLSYILTALLGLGFSVYTILLTQQTYSAIVFRFVVVSLLLNFYIYLSCFLLFFPPLYPVLYPALAPELTRMGSALKRCLHSFK